MATTFDIVQFNGAATSYATGHPYPPKPRWAGADDPFPNIGNRSGYDVVAPQFPAARRERAYAQANASINNNTWQWPMFVHDVNIDIALEGKTAQGRTTRDFYAHNFVMPSFTIQGQALDQRDYGNLTAFLHLAQKQALNDSNTLVQLYIRGMGIEGQRPGGHVRGVTKNGKFLPNQILRGAHQTILCQGYVASMPREHKRGVVSPTYFFDFIVVDMMQGPYQEDRVLVKQQQDWLAIVQATKTFKVNAALKKENSKILDMIAADPTKVLNSNGGSIAGGSASGTGGIVAGAAGSGPRWKVTASDETNDASNGGPGCDGTPSVNITGYSELSTNLNLDFAALGNLPCNTPMIITNPANNRSTTSKKQDNGNGSPFLPVMGIYPATRAAIGLDSSGSHTVIIQRADGKPLKPVRGTLV